MAADRWNHIARQVAGDWILCRASMGVTFALSARGAGALRRALADGPEDEHRHDDEDVPLTNKRWSTPDRALGMDRPITRRDLLQGMAMTGLGAWTAAAFPPSALARADAAAPGAAAGDYPPAWTGMRGSTDGTFEAGHALRDGKTWGDPQDIGEAYDLIVVGAGISGLAAAHFFRARTGPGARILLLDNHDDFGGHARRNEFQLDDRLHLMNGGTLMIDSPRPYSRVADGLLRSLGLNVEALVKKKELPEIFDELGSSRGVFFDRETFGRDYLATGRGGRSWVHFLDEAPLEPQARADLLRIEEGKVDYLPGMSSADKKLLLSRISYLDYLRDYAKVHPQVLKVYESRTKGEWGVGIDAVSALDAWGIESNGFKGLKLEPGEISRMGPTPAGYASTGGSYRLHFPDGNATIARLLVRSLIPGVAPAGDVEGLVTARFDYAQLDRPEAPVRLRLRSTVVRARNLAAGVDQPARAEVTYVRDGRAYRVRAPHCVLACYNMIIPYLCPELPEEQKKALHELVKTPLVYTSVALRSARAFQKLGVRRIEAPGSYHTGMFLNPIMNIGSYHGPRSPDEPTLVQMHRTPCKAGLPEKEQNRAGRAELLATSFETFERNIRDQLGRVLAGGGFDPARDITAITVNRWPHGYAPEYNPLFEPDVPEAQRAHVRGRAPFGRFAIANSDSGGAAYTDVAIDQAHRAIGELLG
jgi:spermidine dehydrogenase